MTLLVQKWLPGKQADTYTVAEAIYLENQYWENMKNAITAGIAQALK